MQPVQTNVPVITAPTCLHCGKPDAGTVATFFCSVECQQAYQAALVAQLKPLTVRIQTHREKRMGKGVK